METQVGDYLVSTDRARLDLDMVTRFLAEDSYWARGIPAEVMRRAVAGSFCVAIYHDGRQVAFARAVTDYATFGHVMDVFVVPEHRGRGLGKLLMKTMLEDAELQGFRRWQLGTDDAHGLYTGFGFAGLAHPERHMERTDVDVYRRRRT